MVKTHPKDEVGECTCPTLGLVSSLVLRDGHENDVGFGSQRYCSESHFRLEQPRREDDRCSVERTHVYQCRGSQFSSLP